MSHPDLTILYVDSLSASTAFYRRILAVEPVEESPTFALFVLKTGLKLGLWSRHTVSPAAAGEPGCGELGFRLESAAEVDLRCNEWKALGVEIAQDVADMEFGRNFLARDPDGHRLRVYIFPQ